VHEVAIRFKPTHGAQEVGEAIARRGLLQTWIKSQGLAFHLGPESEFGFEAVRTAVFV
jgi:hypothetical protein